MGKATQDLRKEHNAILHVMKILDEMMMNTKKGDAVKIQFFNEMVYFFKIFADKCHHGKEENYLFKELVNKGAAIEGGPVGAMLREHELGREYLSLMNESLAANNLTEFYNAAAKYRYLLVSHIEKENNVLFPIADKLLDEVKQSEIFDKFEQYEESVIGHGVHEKLHSMIHSWAAEFEVR